MDLLDPALTKPNPDLLFELERCVQIGLLCVQQSPDDRPTMPSVLAMLNDRSSQILGPKRPLMVSSPIGIGIGDLLQEVSGTHSSTAYRTLTGSSG